MIVLWDVRSGVGRPTLVFVEFVETADVDDGIFDTTTTCSKLINTPGCIMFQEQVKMLRGANFDVNN